MNQDERGLTNGVTTLDKRSVDVCGCLRMSVDVCGCLWCLCLVCGSCWRVEKKGTKQIYAARLGRGAVAVPNRNCHNFSCFHHFPFGPFRTQGRLLKTLTNSRKSSYKEWWVVQKKARVGQTSETMQNASSWEYCTKFNKISRRQKLRRCLHAMLPTTRREITPSVYVYIYIIYIYIYIL